MKIVLTSKSSIKIEAVKEAFETENVIGFESNSGIPEQPYGSGQTYEGACNRIKSLKYIPSDTNLIISIENGVLDFGSEFIDLAVIIGENVETGQRTVVTSPGIPFPREHVYKSIFEQHQEHTVSSFMKGINPKDPHNSITDGEYSRKDLLVQALKILKTL